MSPTSPQQHLPLCVPVLPNGLSPQASKSNHSTQIQWEFIGNWFCSAKTLLIRWTEMIINFDPLRTEPAQAVCWLVDSISNYLKSIILSWGVWSFVRIKFLIFSWSFSLHMTCITSKYTCSFYKSFRVKWGHLLVIFKVKKKSWSVCVCVVCVLTVALSECKVSVG